MLRWPVILLGILVLLVCGCAPQERTRAVEPNHPINQYKYAVIIDGSSAVTRHCYQIVAMRLGGAGMATKSPSEARDLDDEDRQIAIVPKIHLERHDQARSDVRIEFCRLSDDEKIFVSSGTWGMGVNMSGDLEGAVDLAVQEISSNYVRFTPRPGTETDMVPPVSIEAASAVMSAAENGNAESQFIIGEAYELGVSTTQDFAEAYFWYNLSAASGYKKAFKARDRLSKSLPGSTVIDVQQRCKRWKPKSMSTGGSTTAITH